VHARCARLPFNDLTENRRRVLEIWWRLAKIWWRVLGKRWRLAIKTRHQIFKTRRLPIYTTQKPKEPTLPTLPAPGPGVGSVGSVGSFLVKLYIYTRAHRMVLHPFFILNGIIFEAKRHLNQHLNLHLTVQPGTVLLNQMFSVVVEIDT
jgi:hypothetical protein